MLMVILDGGLRFILSPHLVHEGKDLLINLNQPIKTEGRMS